MSWLLDPFMHRCLWVGGWEASHPHIFLWLDGFVFCLPIHCCSKSGTTTGSPYGQRLAALLLLGRLVVCYLYGRFIYYGVYAVRILYILTRRTIGANDGETNGSFFRQPLVAPYPLSFVALMGVSSLPLMHALPTQYEMLVTCHPLSTTFLLHHSPAFVIDSLTDSLMLMAYGKNSPA